MFVSADSTCLVAALQAIQINHYCYSIIFNDYEKIIANHLDKESTRTVSPASTLLSAAITLIVSELIKSLYIDDLKKNLNSFH